MGAVLLTAAASSAWGYQVRTTFQPNALKEGDGFQTVTVEVQREQNDDPAACLMDVTVSARGFTQPPADAATPNVDFTPTTTTLSFTVGSADTVVSQTFNVPVIDDTLQEPTEYFTAVADSATPTDCAPSAVITLDTFENFFPIVDDDGSSVQFSFANAPYQVAENGGSATVTLHREGSTTGPLTVAYQTADGTALAGADYQPVNGSVTWADGDGADKTFTVPIIDDTAKEGDETVLIRASTDSDFVTFSQADLTIIDNEVTTTTGFSVTTASATEDDGQVVLTLVRGGDTAGAVSVDYATADGTAVAGQDYVASAGTVTWADGDGADKTVAIQIIQDTTQEPAEDFVVNLSNVTGFARLSNNAITITIDASDNTREIAGIANLSPNQFVLARWFDQTCPRLRTLQSPTADQQDLTAVCDLLTAAGTDDATVKKALDAVNPEELLVSTFNALRLTALQHGNLSQRLNALRNGATGLSLENLNVQVGDQQIAGRALQEIFDKLVGGGASADEPVWGRWGGFVNGRISAGKQHRSDYEAGFDFDLYSVTTGVDYRVRPNFIIGLSVGMGSVSADFTGESGGLKIDNWDTAAYLTYYRKDTFYLDALATYGGNDYDSRRPVSFSAPGGSVDRVGRGKTDGTQYSFGFGTGWDFHHAGLTFGPHVGGYYFNVDVDGFAETGAGGLDIRVNDQSTTSVTLNGGGQISYAWLTGFGVLVPNAKLDWVHEFQNNRETLAFSFVNDPYAGDPNNPSPAITLKSNRPNPNYLVWSAGLSAQFIYGLSGFVNYQAYTGYGDISMAEWSFGARWEKTF